MPPAAIAKSMINASDPSSCQLRKLSETAVTFWKAKITEKIPNIIPTIKSIMVCKD